LLTAFEIPMLQRRISRALPALYNHVLLHRQLEQRNISMMAPFTDWPHLYQALTERDGCAVDPARVNQSACGLKDPS
jgi:hypothetical protein